MHQFGVRLADIDFQRVEIPCMKMDASISGALFLVSEPSFLDANANCLVCNNCTILHADFFLT